MHKGTYIWENLNAMESNYQYFKRDISWLSFNYRVLLEANDDRLPLYERINFISIYSSNLEEFYKIRVADHKAVASGVTQSDEESVQSAAELLENINREVNRQLEDRIRIYEHKILTALRKNRAGMLNRSIRNSSGTSSVKRYSPSSNRCRYAKIASCHSCGTTGFISRYVSSCTARRRPTRIMCNIS